ncbi:MAG: TrmH family RNA methyltransferase [Bacteroidetes bacterium]|nr:MAG: TrmH family RNA methyltransferase [Bacteroidota bacterium]
MIQKRSMDELGRVTPDKFRKLNKFPIIIVLDNIRSMMNVGSVFRTADAFRIEKIMLCGITACPPNKEIHKTALGATESVDWQYFEETTDAVKALRNENYQVFALEQTNQSISLHSFTPVQNKKYALIFGNEIKGVQENVLNLCHGYIEIPQFGTKHSFNISVTAGITLWDFFSKMKQFDKL